MLVQSNIIFSEEQHTYHTMEGVLLTSVTQMLRRQLFADMYAGVPQSVLNAAAEYGTSIHNEIEMMDFFGTEPTSESAKAYKEMRHAYQPIGNEYLVHSESHAGTIDCVWQAEDGSLVLADIKTTSKLHTDYVMWQLSVYAYMFELCNPCKTITRLFCAWLPKPQYGKPTLQEIDRVPAEVIAELLKADALGEQFIVPEQYKLPVIENAIPAEFADIQEQMAAAISYIKEKEKELAELKERIKVAMEAGGVKKWQSDRLTITYKDAYTKTAFDSKRFKADNEDLYNQYLTTSEVKPSILITVK